MVSVGYLEEETNRGTLTMELVKQNSLRWVSWLGRKSAVHPFFSHCSTLGMLIGLGHWMWSSLGRSSSWRLAGQVRRSASLVTGTNFLLTYRLSSLSLSRSIIIVDELLYSFHFFSWVGLTSLAIPRCALFSEPEAFRLNSSYWPRWFPFLHSTG